MSCECTVEWRQFDRTTSVIRAVTVQALTSTASTHYAVCTRFILNFYRTMLMCYVHNAVLRLHGVRPSVGPSVTLVDCDHIHVGWKSWKLIAPTSSLFTAQTPFTYLLPGEPGKNFGETRARGGVGKMAHWRTKAAICETRKDRGKVTMESL